MGRPSKKVDFVQVEMYASLGLSNEEIALCIGISITTLYEKQKRFQEFADAIARGRAKMAAKCAKSVVEAATAAGKEKDVRAALEYLRRHSNGWKEVPTNLNITGGLANTTQLQVEGGLQINAGVDDATINRMVTAWQTTRGGQ